MTASTLPVEVTTSHWKNILLVKHQQEIIGHVKSWVDADGHELWLAFDAYPFTGAFTLKRTHTGEVIQLALAIPAEVGVASQAEAVSMVADFAITQAQKYLAVFSA